MNEDVLSVLEADRTQNIYFYSARARTALASFNPQLWEALVLLIRNTLEEQLLLGKRVLLTAAESSFEYLVIHEAAALRRRYPDMRLFLLRPILCLSQENAYSEIFKLIDGIWEVCSPGTKEAKMGYVPSVLRYVSAVFSFCPQSGIHDPMERGAKKEAVPIHNLFAAL